jgi:hypothetical protein
MRQLRAFQLLLVAVAVAAVAGLGCGSKDKDKDKNNGKGDKNGQKTGNGKSNLPPLSADAKKALAMFPMESVAVGGVNLAKARDSQLFATIEPLLQSYGAGSLDALKKGCDLDPLAEIDSVVVAIRNAKERDALVVIRGIERKAMSECIKVIAAGAGGKDAKAGDEAGDEAGKPKAPKGDKKSDKKAGDEKAGPKGEEIRAEKPIDLDIAEDGDYVTVATKDNKATFMWLDDTTFFGGIGVTKADIEGLVAGGKGLDQSTGFMAMVGKVDTTGGVWLVARETKGVMGMEFDTALLSIDFFGGLKIATSATFGSAADAEATVGRINKRLDELRGSTIADYMNNLVVGANGNEAKIEWELTDAEIAEFKEVYKKDVQMQVVWGIAKKKIQSWISPPEKKVEAGDE